MKKSIIIIIILLFVLVLGIIGTYLIDMNRMKNNKEVIFSTWGYSYAPPVNLSDEKIENTNNLTLDKLKENKIIETYSESVENHINHTYYKMSDGTWKTDDCSYKYRLEITGKMSNAAKDSTFVYLSNIEEISFEQAYLSAGLSSNTNDYFDVKDAILVEMY